MGKLTDLIPWLRARRTGWSGASDRAFHDALFAAHDHDAFSPAYTGNITIRRFADLAEPHVDGCSVVLDVGCGLGEITCELARRHPEVRFLGVDHSESGVAGARGNAERLGLENATFEVADMERFEPATDVDLVVMFDAFHHLLDPRGFIDRMGRHTRRLLLIEPQGDWKGSWKRDLDFDWLAGDLEKIRAHVAYAAGEASTSTDPSSRAPKPPAGADLDVPDPRGEPVENRYSIETFEKMFAGYGLRVRGTVSGLDEYPPDPTLDTPSRRAFGDTAYRLYRFVDEQLRESGADLHAKHLVIYAEKGAETEHRTPADDLPPGSGAAELRGAYDVELIEYDGPDHGPADATLHGCVRLRNRSFRVLSSDDDAHPDQLSYHWLDADRREVGEGPRSRLPRGIPPDDAVDVSLRITTPATPGDYVLAIDLVQEGKTWFRDAGSPTLDIVFRVTGRS